ncbi:MAG: hypothetical protein IPH76_18885 [Xanthomonadales bacterium]|nr:hypothetical protein [Xanthomonadales bacterium]
MVLFGSALEVYPGSDPGRRDQRGGNRAALARADGDSARGVRRRIAGGALALAAMLLATLLALREAWTARNASLRSGCCRQRGWRCRCCRWCRT